MLKKLIDTNIFIDRFSSPDLYKNIFHAEGHIYLSSIVLMELRAGAHTKQTIKAVNERVNKTISLPVVKLERGPCDVFKIKITFENGKSGIVESSSYFKL